MRAVRLLLIRGLYRTFQQVALSVQRSSPSDSRDMVLRLLFDTAFGQFRSDVLEPSFGVRNHIIEFSDPLLLLPCCCCKLQWKCSFELTI